MGSCASVHAAVDRDGVAPVAIIVSSVEATPPPRLDAQTQTPSSCWPVYDYHPALLYNAALLYPADMRQPPAGPQRVIPMSNRHRYTIRVAV